MKAVFLSDNLSAFNSVYREKQINRLNGMCKVGDTIIGSADLPGKLGDLTDAEYVFSTWGMPVLSEEHIDAMTSLKAVFYAAGSVKYFALPYIRRGIQVISAASVNGHYVARMTVAEMFLLSKGYYRVLCSGAYSAKAVLPQNPRQGWYRLDIGIIGAGNIGREVISMLVAEGHRIRVFDPYLSDTDAAVLGAGKSSLEELFSTSLIVSNHAPDIPSTRGMITGEHFASMPQGASFINTGRGATVCEEQMITALRSRPDITALLDVTFPEPPAADGALLSLPNVFYSPHIAGAIGGEVCAMADFCIDQFKALTDGKKPEGLVTKDIFDRLA